MQNRRYLSAGTVMRTIGLCCCYANHNYGSMLQAYANIKVIESLGNKCEIVNYVKDLTLPEKLRWAPRVLNSYNLKKQSLGRKRKRLLSKNPEIARQISIRNSAFDRFKNKTFTKYLSKPFVGYKQLVKGSSRYDAVMVGSDQLWLPSGLATNFYNLQFVLPGIRRISYATSFGTESIPWYQISRTKKYLEKIDYLSVREAAGAELVESLIHKEPAIVVDPTLLLDKETWLKEIPNDFDISDYIFCYFLGNNTISRDDAQKLRIATGLPIVVLKHLDDIYLDDENFGDIPLYDVDPSNFINLIRNASYVLTDSFHGTVFSIINEKKFATYYRFKTSDKQSRNSRIDSLLDRTSLRARLVNNEACLFDFIYHDWNYEGVKYELDTWRTRSWGFLKEALS